MFVAKFKIETIVRIWKVIITDIHLGWPCVCSPTWNVVAPCPLKNVKINKCSLFLTMLILFYTPSSSFDVFKRQSRFTVPSMDLSILVPFEVLTWNLFKSEANENILHSFLRNVHFRFPCFNDLLVIHWPHPYSTTTTTMQVIMLRRPMTTKICPINPCNNERPCPKMEQHSNWKNPCALYFEMNKFHKTNHVIKSNDRKYIRKIVD